MPRRCPGLVCEPPGLLRFVLSWGFVFVLPPAPAWGDRRGPSPPFGGDTSGAPMVFLAMDWEVLRCRGSREELGAVRSGGTPHPTPWSWQPGSGWDGRKEPGTHALGRVTPVSPLVTSQVQAAALCSEMSA